MIGQIAFLGGRSNTALSPCFAMPLNARGERFSSKMEKGSSLGIIGWILRKTSTLLKLGLCSTLSLPSEIISATLGLTFTLTVKLSRLPWRILAARVPLLTSPSRRFYSVVVSWTLLLMFVSSPLTTTQRTYHRRCVLTSTACSTRKPGAWWSVVLVRTHLTSCR